jgi:hypothetical protein
LRVDGLCHSVISAGPDEWVLSERYEERTGWLVQRQLCARPGRRYTPARARRLLSILAERAGLHRYARFRPTLLHSGTKAEAITGGAVMGITLGLIVPPLGLLIIGVGLDLIFGFLSRLPSIPDIDLLG